MLVNIDGPEIESFKPHKSIGYWYKHSTSKHTDRKAHAKEPAHGNMPHEKSAPKPKQTKLNKIEQNMVTQMPYKTKTAQYFL